MNTIPPQSIGAVNPLHDGMAPILWEMVFMTNTCPDEINAPPHSAHVSRSKQSTRKQGTAYTQTRHSLHTKKAQPTHKQGIACTRTRHSLQTKQGTCYTQTRHILHTNKAQVTHNLDSLQGYLTYKRTSPRKILQ